MGQPDRVAAENPGGDAIGSRAMTTQQVALKSHYCSGCFRTVDLVPAGPHGGRCPGCGSRFLLDVPGAIADLRPLQSGYAPKHVN
jgi:hypothetical protein